MQLIKHSWKYNREKDSYSRLLTTQEDNKPQELILEPGLELRWKFSAERYCPGFFDLNEYRPCPDQKLLPDLKYDLCARCEAELGFKAAFLFGQEPNERAKKYLSQPHYVYLAYFEPGILKVGTASESRKEVRLIEQDGLVYAFVAKTQSGFNVTNVERMISKTLGLTETIRSSHKFNFLQTIPDPQKSQALITDAYQTLLKALGRDKNFAHYLLKQEDFEIRNLAERPEIFYPAATPHNLTNELVLFGKFSGVRGRYLLFESDNKIFAVNHKHLTGRLIENINSHTYATEVPQQLGMF